MDHIKMIYLPPQLLKNIGMRRLRRALISKTENTDTPRTLVKETTLLLIVGTLIKYKIGKAETYCFILTNIYKKP